MVVNILAATTTQWNCGDEFILYGVQNLLKEVYEVPINWCVYDRNPDIVTIRRNNEKIERHRFSNSWRKQKTDQIDEVVVAGSPDWCGNNLIDLFKQCQNRQLILLGIGTNRSQLSKLDQTIIKNAKIITTRDKAVQKTIKEMGVESHCLPCPGLFASKTHEQRTKCDKIGVVIQNTHVISQRVKEELRDQTLLIAKTFNSYLICHYIDEYFWALENYDKDKVLYSYNAKDYLEIYNKFDFIVSTRLHGAILANSLGIPSVLLNRDRRCREAVKLFPHIDNKHTEQSQIEDMVANKDFKKWSQKIIDFKEKKWFEYVKLLRDKLRHQ